MSAASSSNSHPGCTGRNVPHAKYAANGAAAAADAKALHKALKEGWFTNEEGTFGILCRRTSAHIQDIRIAYNTEFKSDLLEDVKKGTGGFLEDLLKGLVMSNAEYDAYRIHRACEGLGTDEEQLIDVLAHREVYEIAAINNAYQKMYGRSALAEIEKELSGEIGLLFSGLVNPANTRATPASPDKQIEIDVQALYDASQGKLVGRNVDPFIRIFTQSNSAYLKRVYQAYVNKHGKTLEKIIADWTLGGIVAKTLLAMITPAPEYYGMRFMAAMKGVGTNESQLVRLLVTQRERYLPQIADWFIHEYKKSLKEWVKSETSGDFNSAMVSLLEYYAEPKA